MTFEEFSQASTEILLRLAKNRDELKKLILDVPKKHLSLSARYQTLDKIVLENSDDLQVRLHIYFSRKPDSQEADITLAHNHRWNFSSFILSGGYRHTLYEIHPHSYIEREEKPGSFYTLHHSQYHSIMEQPDTVTLIVRGPPEKEHFQTIDERGNITQYSSNDIRRKMDTKSYEELVLKLKDLKVIS